MEKQKYNISYLIFITLASAFGGLLFGYDWVVIGGAKPFYEKFFHIHNAPVVQGWAMSCALVGCLSGALLSGALSDKFGRKKLLLLSAFIFITSSLAIGLINSFPGFVIFRIFGGVGIGLASTLSPMYIAEVSPAKIRGKFVSLNQLTVVIGILLAQVVNYLIADPVTHGATDLDILNSWNGQMGWRWMFWACAVPATFFFLFVLFIPESPRWLAKRNQDDKVRSILARIGGSEYAELELKGIKETLSVKNEGVKFSDLFGKGMSKILFLGIALAVFQQWCGINVIFNYAEEIFASAGYGVSDILFNIVITGSVNLVFTFVAIYTVDKIGRRALMLFGSGGLFVLYIIVGLMYSNKLHGLPLLILVVSAIAVYSMTLAPIVWVVLSEIFPNKIRGAAMAIATFFLWTACFILTYTFPILNSTFGSAGTFWLYAGICLLGFCLVKFRLPETKGKTLEEIEKELLK
jgi:MFS transporter, SP family, arabinose:H+ symporter